VKISISSAIVLCIILIMGINPIMAFEITPENPTVGDEITISGTGSGDSVDSSVVFTKNVGVDNGKYEYNIDGVEIPSGDNRFTVRAEGVQDLNVRVKILFWITKSADASVDVATVSQSNVPSGNYNIKIDGNAANGQSNVDLKITAIQTMDITNGQFEETYSTSNIPAGDFKVTVADESKIITLNSSGSSSSGGSSGGSSGSGNAFYTMFLQKGWNLVSVPFTPLSSTALIFEDYDDVLLPSYTWNTKDKQYHEVNNFEIGKAYWVLALNDTDVEINATGYVP
jgi:hypothetical protein